MNRSSIELIGGFTTDDAPVSVVVTTVARKKRVCFRMRRADKSLSGVSMKTTSRSNVDGATGASLRRYDCSVFSTLQEYICAAEGCQQQWSVASGQLSVLSENEV